jgi:hypothetical protein
MRILGRLGFAVVVVLALILVVSCKSASNQPVSDRIQAELIKQQPDGTVSLKLEKAGYYNDKDNPSSNTAEWRFVVSKSGRYEIWLSSATRDTLDMKFINSVRLTIHDERLELKHSGEKVILNNDDARYPYRADSYIGSYYFQEPGEYTIQLISEKAVLSDAGNTIPAHLQDTKLMSVSLVPMTR